MTKSEWRNPNQNRMTKSENIRAERSRQCLGRGSLRLQRRFGWHYGGTICNNLIAGDEAVTDAENAAGVLGHLFLVGNDDDCVSFPGKLVEEIQDFSARFRIQI